MLWYCSFTWYPGTTRAQVAQRFIQQHDAGTNYPERIRGWYNLVGGGSEAGCAKRVGGLYSGTMDRPLG